MLSLAEAGHEPQWGPQRHSTREQKKPMTQITTGNSSGRTVPAGTVPVETATMGSATVLGAARGAAAAGRAGAAAKLAAVTAAAALANSASSALPAAAEAASAAVALASDSGSAGGLMGRASLATRFCKRSSSLVSVELVAPTTTPLTLQSLVGVDHHTSVLSAGDAC
ncbi:hypothetical protein ACLKA7_005583 [Drosophila subpalustris]